jgi:hypothetical protein
MEKYNNLVRIEDIKIPSSFSILVPSIEKMKRKSKYFDENGSFDKPITVVPETNECGKPNKLFLVDGYINYLIALCRNEKYVPVEYQYEYIV